MKKILLAALAAVTLFGAMTATAYQSGSGPGVATRFVYEPLKFRTHKAAGFLGQAGAVSDFGSFDAIDSSVVAKLGVASTSSPFETTTAVPTEGWALPVAASFTGVVDSGIVFCNFVAFESRDTTQNSDLAADSIYVATQVSPDGQTWITTYTTYQAAITAGGLASRLTQAAAAGQLRACLSLNRAAASSGAQVFRVGYKMRTLDFGSDTFVNDSDLWQWPYVRWIINFHKANLSVLEAKVGHWVGVQ